MMQKAGRIVIIIIVVAAAYGMITIFQPITNSMVQTANSSIAASSNWSNYPETQAVLLGWPFWLWMLPGSAGVLATVVVLTKKDNNR